MDDKNPGSEEIRKKREFAYRAYSPDSEPPSPESRPENTEPTKKEESSTKDDEARTEKRQSA